MVGEDEFFCAVIAEFAPEPQRGSSTRVLDVGCGTGRLATGLAGAGYEVTGLDPARASIEFARSREGGETVAWIEGTSQEIRGMSFEVAVMTKHVAQFFISDDAWATVLADASAALVPGGILTFDMRDARNREWDEWTPDAVDVVTLPDGREVEEWTEITDETSNTVRFRLTTRFRTERPSPVRPPWRSGTLMTSNRRYPVPASASSTPSVAAAPATRRGGWRDTGRRPPSPVTLNPWISTA